MKILPLLDKIAIITGGSEGLGFEIAKKFILAGASIAICSRNKKNLKSAEFKLKKLLNKNQKLLTIVADISKEKDVKKLIKITIQKLGDCSILVNNAGIYGPKNKLEKTNWKEWKKTIEINLFGSVLMCKELINHFKKKRYGKIIQLSGGGATNPLPYLSAYAASKAAIIRFSETLANEVANYNISVNAIAPGALNTRMLDEVIKAGPDKVGIDFYKRSVNQKKTGGTPLSNASDLAVFLASSQSDDITGKLISALWDKWEDWPKYADKIMNSDVYTIRRIVGKDRGFFEGDK
jgi:NAD(P)-dependent dehydrogenase (short-subunit alcohol dehydrogenase family)